MASAMSTPGLATTAEHLMAAKMCSLAACVMIFYDMTITFGDEVEKIWKQQFTGATILWFMNRYLSPLGFVIVTVSFHADWPIPVCERYVRFPEILKIFTTFAIGVVFILRLYSIYSRNITILLVFSALLLGELGVKIWAFTDGTRLDLPPPLVGCILVGKSPPGQRFVYTWVAELIFDTAVFSATLYRTVSLYRTTQFGAALSLVGIIMRDGIMYYAAIFASNLITVLIFVVAPPDLKAVNATFSTLITSLMVSRLMLNLRREVVKHRSTEAFVYSDSRKGFLSSPTTTTKVVHSRATSSFFTPSSLAMTLTDQAFHDTIIGNLGAPLSSWAEEDEPAWRSGEAPRRRPNELLAVPRGRPTSRNLPEILELPVRHAAGHEIRKEPIAVEVSEVVVIEAPMSPQRVDELSEVNGERDTAMSVSVHAGIEVHRSVTPGFTRAWSPPATWRSHRPSEDGSS